jgi:AraC-like DNA-binding protein
MYFPAMLQTRNELLGKFANLEFVDHPAIGGLKTFPFLAAWANKPAAVELPYLRTVIHGIDYLRKESGPADTHLLRFQQDHYRLWYQIDGTGILQNVTRNVFGAARPGLLGIMEHGQRHTYLHQKGVFECFLLDFSLHPSVGSRCYWNAEVEGKCVLQEAERTYVENLIFDLLRIIAGRTETMGLSPVSRLVDLIVVLFEKGLLSIADEQFPRNKTRSLVALARSFMNTHYGTIRHQRELEQECGVDINYLNILFKKETEKTLYDYLTEVRMEHSKHLLEEDVMPVVDIAARVGYPNSNSFARMFRKHVGVSPTEYRSKQASPAQSPAR